MVHTVLLVAECSEKLSPSLCMGSWNEHAQDGGHTVGGDHHVLLGSRTYHLLEHLETQVGAPLAVRGGLGERPRTVTQGQQDTQTQNGEASHC